MSESSKKTSMGLDQNVAGLLCYLGWWITGLIFFLMEKENKFVRFHAMQSIILFLILWVIAIVFMPFLWWLGGIFGAIIVILWIFLMYEAYQGKMFKLPIIGDIAEKQSKPVAPPPQPPQQNQPPQQQPPPPPAKQ